MEKMYVNEKSYEVIKLLGHGKGGYSYLVTDGTKEYIEGDTIFDYVLRNEVKPIFVEQVKEMCLDLYAVNTNIDYLLSSVLKESQR